MRGERPTPTEAIPEEAANARRQAKLDWLVKEELFKPEEFEGRSADELDQLLETEFDPYYSQDVNRPDVIKEKTAGQVAEEVLAEFINELNLGIQAECSKDVDDQGREKIDIWLKFPGGQTLVQLQVTTRTDEGVVRKFRGLVERTIPVIIPGKKIFEAARTRNTANMRSIVYDVLQQVIEGMRARPHYQAELRALEQAYRQRRIK